MREKWFNKCEEQRVGGRSIEESLPRVEVAARRKTNSRADKDLYAERRAGVTAGR